MWDRGGRNERIQQLLALRPLFFFQHCSRPIFSEFREHMDNINKVWQLFQHIFFDHAGNPHGSSQQPQAPRSRRGEGEVLPLILLYRLSLAVCGRQILNGGGVGNFAHATLATETFLNHSGRCGAHSLNTVRSSVAISHHKMGQKRIDNNAKCERMQCCDNATRTTRGWPGELLAACIWKMNNLRLRCMRFATPWRVSVSIPVLTTTAEHGLKPCNKSQKQVDSSGRSASPEYDDSAAGEIQRNTNDGIGWHVQPASIPLHPIVAILKQENIQAPNAPAVVLFEQFEHRQASSS